MGIPCRRFEERPWNTKAFHLKFRNDQSLLLEMDRLSRSNRMRTGMALTRADAVLDAESAIEKALENRNAFSFTDATGPGR